MDLNEKETSVYEGDAIPIEGVVIPPMDGGFDNREEEKEWGGAQGESVSPLVDEMVTPFENTVGHSDKELSSIESEKPMTPVEKMPSGLVSRAVPIKHKGTTSDSVKTFGEMTARSSRLFQGLNLAFLSLLIFGTGLLVAMGDGSGATAFASIVLCVFLILVVWKKTKGKGLPMLPVFVAQQGVIYSVPFLARDEAFLLTSKATLGLAAFSVVLFLGATFAGWKIATGLVKRLPLSRFPLILLDRANRKQRSLFLGLGFLLFAFLFQIGARTGIIFELLPGGTSRLFPVVRTLADAATMLGAIVGGMVVSNRNGGIAKPTYFALVIANLLLSTIDFRLMAGATILVASATGLAMSRRRVPWAFVIVSFLFLGFLNQSKFTMRERYWEDDNSWNAASISEYPKIYREWATESWKILTTTDGGMREALLAKNSNKDTGQSILDRVDNLQNLTYTIDAIREKQIPVLQGETYLITPKLLIPRIFWEDKPRSHEGQVILNLHFQRQTTREQTEVTYVAWGALPEAVGNFGPFFGPVWMGLIIGLVLGVLERLSVRQHLFSIEGLLLIGSLVKIGTAHEMVASVFVTSLFQYVVIICFAGAIIRTFFATVDPNIAKYPPAPLVE